MAEAEERVVVVPHLLQIAKVPVEVSVQVGVHFRNPAVAIRMKVAAMYDALSVFTESNTGYSLYFIPSL